MADEARSKRAAALEEKKRRLEALKARRQMPRAASSSSDAPSDSTLPPSAAAAGGNLDDYIDGLLKSKAPEVLGIDVDDGGRGGGGKGTGAIASTTTTPTTSTSKEGPVAPSGPTTAKSAATAETKSRDSVQVGAESAPAPPQSAAPARSVETFTCGTQTEEDDFPPSLDDDDDDDDEEEERKKREAAEKAKEESENSALAKKGAKSGGRAEGDDDGGAPPLSPDEVESTVRSAPFSKFLTSASKKVERLLGAPVLADLLVDADYAGETDDELGDDGDDIGDEAVDYDDETAVDRDDGDAAGTQARRAIGKRRKKKKKRGESDLLRACVTYECSRWTAGRDCTDLDWCPIHRELVLATYHSPRSSFSSDVTAAAAATAEDMSGLTGLGAAVRAISPTYTPSASLMPRSGELRSDGLALVWSLAMPTRPEHIFTCGSPVLAGRFHPTEHHLLVGGCQSGQVVVWDIRAGRLPVQRSSMAAGSGIGLCGHAHPICSMEIVEGGSGLVTAATDGRINFWSLANLRDPAESLIVGGPISCLAVAPESGTLICGDEKGSIHAVLASADAGNPSSSSTTSNSLSSSSRRTVRRIDAGSLDDHPAAVFSSPSSFPSSSPPPSSSSPDVGHFGVVTSIATKPTPRTGGHISRGFLRGSSGLVLSTGVDWTTRLWAPAYKDAPLLSLLSHSYDYMCDAQWNPAHPSVFATASSNGTLGLWNLSHSLDEPMSGIDGISVAAAAAGATTSGSSVGGLPDVEVVRGLNKIRWSQDGRRLAVASSDLLHVISVSEEVSRPKADDESKMMSNLTSRGLLHEL